MVTRRGFIKGTIAAGLGTTIAPSKTHKPTNAEKFANRVKERIMPKVDFTPKGWGTRVIKGNERNESAKPLRDILLSEAKPPRPVSVSLRLLHRLGKRDDMRLSSDEIRPLVPVIPWKQMTHRGWPISHETFAESGKMMDVPVHLIDTTQHSVLPKHLESKLKGAKDHDPPVPYLIHDPSTNRYRLFDGNHRVSAARLSRHETVSGLVVHADMPMKFDESRNLRSIIGESGIEKETSSLNRVTAKGLKQGGIKKPKKRLPCDVDLPESFMTEENAHGGEIFGKSLGEAVRDRARAQKVIDYIADRHGRDENEIPFKNYDWTGSASPSFKGDRHMFDYKGTVKMKMSDLHAGQPFFSKAGLDHYNDSFNYNFRNPIKAVYYPHLDKTIIHDGHHRWLTNRLKGIKEDDVQLYHANEHWKDEE